MHGHSELAGKKVLINILGVDLVDVGDVDLARTWIWKDVDDDGVDLGRRG